MAQMVDEFADLLSRHDLESGDLGGSIADCADRMGISKQMGDRLFGKIISGLGHQSL